MKFGYPLWSLGLVLTKRLYISCGIIDLDTFTQANIVSSIELDKECRRVATAGVLRQIKIFEVDNLKDRSVKMHFPIQEFATKAKLSSLSWNKHISNHLVSCL